tara:strand:+ start:261 stop:1226 length:966 start_codon:yes stop_codon:yes gene_type:complete
VQAAVSNFVPVADELHRLRTGRSVEARFFQAVAKQNPKHPGHQGVFLATASGKLLASATCKDSNAMLKLLDRGRIAWQALPVEARGAKASDWVGDQKSVRAEDAYPDRGLVLRVTSRDLPRESLLGSRARRWHRYFLWFDRAEARSMLPARLEQGQRISVPPGLARRLATLALVDKGRVDGFTKPFRDRDVVRADWSFEVVEVSDSRVSVRIGGATETRTRDAQPFVASFPKHEKLPSVRGVRTRIIGSAVWDRRRELFTSFEMVAAGNRFGGAFVGRGPGDWDEAPIGFSLRQAGSSAAERVAPEYPDRYPWIVSRLRSR